MKRFKKVYIEITNLCNLSCEFCPKTKRKVKFMDCEEFQTILEQIRPFTDFIYFHVLGEPLLHPELRTFLTLSGQMGFKVNITTNGTLIGDKKEILLASTSLRQVNFSLHSYYANERGCSLENYINSILDFAIEASSYTKIISSFRLWNLHADAQGTQISEENNIIIDILEKRLAPGINIIEELKKQNGIKLCNGIYLNLANRFDWPDLSLEESETSGFCYGLRDQIGILADGTVIPCCLDSEGTITLGNVFEAPFSEIIENERSVSIYEGFSRREAVEELCKKCGYRMRFGK